MNIISLLKQTYTEWSNDKATRLGAALSFYTILSIAPLVVVAAAVATLFVGADAVQSQLHETLSGLMGLNGAKAIEDMAAANSANRGTGAFSAVVGILTLIFAASGVFAELQDSLNTIWGVKTKPGAGWASLIRDRFLSLSMVLGTGFLLLVSLLVSAVLAGVGKYVSGALPGGELLWSIINFVFSLAVIAFLFAMIFKYVPDVVIKWRDALPGAFVTALLFVIGKELIGLYLGRSSVSSAYGAAGALILVLLWVYYVSQIFFFGVEFTQVLAAARGSGLIPSANAIRVSSRRFANP